MPDISGVIIERRDQVRITCLAPERDQRVDLPLEARLDVRTLLERSAPSTSFLDASRCSCPCAGCCASCGPWSDCPTGVHGWRPPEVLAFAAAHAGGRPGSSRRRARSGGCPSQRERPALPMRHGSRARRCRPDRSSRCSRRAPCVSRPSAAQRRVAALARHQLRADARGRAPAARPCRASARWRGPRCRAGCSASGSALPGWISGARAPTSLVADLEARAAPGCSASRRPRSGAARCRAERFGSYSIAATFAGMSDLVAPEVDLAVAGACGRRRGDRS